MGDQDSILKDLIRLIPGYGAYVDQESRRDDDRKTRAFLVDRLDACKKVVDVLGVKAVAAGDLEAPAKLEQLRNQLDLAQSRLNAAVEGYAGWFSERKVDADLLAEIAELDANLISVVDQIDSGLQNLADDSMDLQAITENVRLLHQRIDSRDGKLRAGA